jgi:chromosome segregation ATPase
MTGTNSEVFERIFKAADSLYEEGGRVDFPTVDAVRKAAKVNMNDASAAMKQWRRAQTAQAAPIVVQVPESIAQVGNQAMATIWQQAQELANDSLRSAQAGWEAERQELDVMRQELATAFEEQGEELKLATARLAELETQLAASVAKSTELTASCAEVKRLHSVAEGRAEELAQRSGDLRLELDRAYAQADAARDEARTLKAAIEKERETRSQEHIKHGEELQASKEEAQALKVELASVKSTAEAWKETIKRLNDDIDVIKRSRDSDVSDLKEVHKKEISRCEDRAKSAIAKSEKQASELAEAKELIAELRGRLSVLEVKPKGKA